MSTILPLIRGITAKPLGGAELSTKVPETFQHLFGVTLGHVGPEPANGTLACRLRRAYAFLQHGELVIVRRFANALSTCLITTPERGDRVPDFGHTICIPHGPSQYIRSVPKPASPVSRERGTRRKQLGLMANSYSRGHPKRPRTASREPIDDSDGARPRQQVKAAGKQAPPAAAAKPCRSIAGRRSLTKRCGSCDAAGHLKDPGSLPGDRLGALRGDRTGSTAFASTSNYASASPGAMAMPGRSRSCTAIRIFIAHDH